MIEKKIHYIWFGGEKPKKVLDYIATWKKYLPDYEIIEWNEKNFDVKKEMQENRFFRECYKRKLWAFVADYIRVKILYKYGGIYFDTDIEVVKSFDLLLDNELFLGYEDKDTLNLAVVGVEKNHILLKKMFEFYQKDIWKSSLYIITSILTKTIKEIYGENFKSNDKIKFYSQEYFYPYNHDEEFTKECITSNTYTIHWWEKSWGKNPKVYFLKYKHLPWWKRYPKHICKLINYYFKFYILQKSKK